MKNNSSLYEFTDESSSFRVAHPQRFSTLYFPLVNEMGIMSSIGTSLQGDIKLDQHSFLTVPTATEDLRSTRFSRNFWLTFKTKKTGAPWSVTGQSPMQRGLPEGAETVVLDAGLLWHQITRRNKELGIEARVINFIPASMDSVEVMAVDVKNIGSKPMEFTATSAVPLYGRSADNLRDHRHVTSLLNRLSKEKYGLRLKPTMSFNERGHSINETSFFVLGSGASGEAPAGFFPTVDSFVGVGGDLERPEALFKNKTPQTNIKRTDHGKEAMGALQFKSVRLKPGATARFTLLLGIYRGENPPAHLMSRFTRRGGLERALEETKKYWSDRTSQISFYTGDPRFNLWVRWVSAQPTFRKLFGCSFLPDFDYGRGGRGWRDLWQDCLALLLADPAEVRNDIVHNYGGVRVDGSNATIIGRLAVPGTGVDGKPVKWKPEFIADRNNITRVWMDHGIWPYLTTRLYFNQTGDWSVWLEEVPYFRDPLTHRGQKKDGAWKADDGTHLRAADKSVYKGTVLEHILLQTLVQFFNVGDHNVIRLEDADWNDGLDMAHERGESVAFTHLYAGNLESLAELLETARDKAGWKEVQILEEAGLLLDRLGGPINYDSPVEKRARLQEYFNATAKGVRGKRKSFSIESLIKDLRDKAGSIKAHLNRQEWIEDGKENLGWFNGYYDNTGARVEGRQQNGSVRMTLTGQVFAIMSRVANDDQVKKISDAVNRKLYDSKLGGFRLNTDFGDIQPNLGRAFSFAFGEKENGAVFSHMVVMYANALYQRGFSKEGFQALNSLFEMAVATDRSNIYPCLPEYFNNEAQGRYSYLTGSASWYVLTLLTEAFGARGEAGDLVLAPRLQPSQFDKKNEAVVEFNFAGSRLRVIYKNADRSAAENAHVVTVQNGSHPVPFKALPSGGALIDRKRIQDKGALTLTVELRRKNNS